MKTYKVNSSFWIAVTSSDVWFTGIMGTWITSPNEKQRLEGMVKTLTETPLPDQLQETLHRQIAKRLLK